MILNVITDAVKEQAREYSKDSLVEECRSTNHYLEDDYDRTYLEEIEKALTKAYIDGYREGFKKMRSLV